jgi:DNA-binding transcriptional ArsR family regulator
MGMLPRVMDERVRLLEDLANPVRYGVLTRLERGPATATELAAALGVSPTQLANHLRRLRDRGLVTVQHRGRHAAYELAEPGLRELFSVLNELRDVRSDNAPALLPSVAVSTCYDHLAGRVGVALFDALAEAGAIVPEDAGVRLGERAADVLDRFGVEIPAARRRLMAYACLDSAEGRPHLGGALGAELARTLVERGWVEPGPERRAARLTPAGERELQALLGAGRL